MTHTWVMFGVAREHARRRFSVIHVNNPPDFLIVAGALPRLFGARLVFDVHDFAPELFEMRFGDRSGGGAAARLLMRVERAAIRVADAVITVHEPYRRELVRKGARPERVWITLNTLDDRLIPARTSDTSFDPFRIVYHGTLTWHYGVDLLLSALPSVRREIPSTRAEIFGAGDELAALQEQAARLQLDNVYFEGRFLPQQEVMARVAEAFVGILVDNRPLSGTRSLSHQLFEYAALRIPAIAVDLPGIREYFDDAEVLFVKPERPDELAAALAETFQNPDATLARRRRVRAVSRVLSAG